MIVSHHLAMTMPFEGRVRAGSARRGGALGSLQRSIRPALVLGAAALLASGCRSVRSELPEPAAARTDVVEAILLQLNDVYEITAIEDGRSGGLARVATLRRQLLAENPNTFTLIAGDFVSPSALGTAKVEGETLAGRQMVAVLNAIGLDVATFGNHEFDIREAQLRQRLAESRFRWTSANVTATGQPFAGVSRHEVLVAKNASGKTLRLGVIGVTLDSNKAPWVAYTDPRQAVADQIAALGQAEVVIALTHLAFADDVALAAGLPAIDLVLGGHEHENVRAYRGADWTPVLKADANARTVYVHRLRYHGSQRRLEVDSRLVPIDETIAEDPQVAAVVADWVERGYAGFRQQGFEPDALVAQLTEPLDGREAGTRNGRTNLTELIARACLAEVPGAELALYNSGSIRIDDVLPVGSMTQYDVIRVLPFGGLVQEVEIQGGLLARALTQGELNQGSGGFLQSAGIAKAGDSYTLGGQPLDPQRWYRMAITDYLASGQERNLEFLKPGTEMRVIADHRDVRMALISQLGRDYPLPAKAAWWGRSTPGTERATAALATM
jgi:5'-nucleotidase